MNVAIIYLKSLVGPTKGDAANSGIIKILLRYIPLADYLNKAKLAPMRTMARKTPVSIFDEQPMFEKFSKETDFRSEDTDLSFNSIG